MSDITSLTEGLKALEDERKSALKPLAIKERDLAKDLRDAYQQMPIKCGTWRCDAEFPMREWRYTEPNWPKGLPQFTIWNACEMECPKCGRRQTIWNHREHGKIHEALCFAKKYGYTVLALFSEESISYGRIP